VAAERRRRRVAAARRASDVGRPKASQSAFRSDLTRARLLLFLRGTLQTGVRSTGELALELFDSTGRIHILQLARVKRVTGVADVNLQLFPRAARLERVAATAGDRRLEIAGMNVFFHVSPQS